MNNSQIPVARKQGLVVQEMPDEVLIYDLDTNKAHCLNKTAAFVWKSCDGNNSIADITKSLESGFGSPVKEDLVWFAIEQLNDKNLLNESLTTNFTQGQTRREVIKKIGFASIIALPIVASIAAPTSVMASASCACVTPGDCPAQVNCMSANCNGSGVCAP